MANRRTGLRRWLVRNRAAVSAEVSARRASGELYWDEVMAWTQGIGAPVHDLSPNGFRMMWERSLRDRQPEVRSPPRVVEHAPPAAAAEKPVEAGDKPKAGVAGILKRERFE